MPAPITANTISVTYHAQAEFETAVQDLTSIGNSVNESAIALQAGGMVSESGQTWAKGAMLWCDYFNDIKQSLEWMASQLGQTAHQIQVNEERNVDLASGISGQIG
jgi:hypothetical protein